MKFEQIMQLIEGPVGWDQFLSWVEDKAGGAKVWWIVPGGAYCGDEDMLVTMYDGDPDEHGVPIDWTWLTDYDLRPCSACGRWVPAHRRALAQAPELGVTCPPCKVLGRAA